MALLQQQTWIKEKEQVPEESEAAKTYHRLLAERPITTAPKHFKVDDNEFQNVHSKINKLEELGVMAAYENALLLVAKKGPLPKDVREFIAKEIELFGRRWNSGVTNKGRYKTSPSNKKKQIYEQHKSFVEIKRNEAIEIAEQTRLQNLEEARLAKLSYERKERMRKKREKKASIEIQRIARGKLGRKYVANIRREREVERQHVFSQCQGCIDHVINTIYEVHGVLDSITITLEQQQVKEMEDALKHAQEEEAKVAESATLEIDENEMKQDGDNEGEEVEIEKDGGGEALSKEEVEEQNQAATKLQALQRGKKARKDFIEKKKNANRKPASMPSPPRKTNASKKGMSPRKSKNQKPPPPPKK